MNEQNNEFFDVLGALESLDVHNVEEPTQNTIQSETVATPVDSGVYIMDDSDLFFQEETQTVENTVQETIPVKKNNGSIYNNIIFLCKYLSTSALIFVVLLFTTNYSAYYNVISSYVFQKDFQEKSQSLLNSVQANSIVEEIEETEVSLESATVRKLETEFNSIEVLAAKAKSADVDLGISINPYENRVVIPKIGKNIPLIDIKQKKVEGMEQLNDIFMKELENGVIRYPGSAKPGEEGNMFVFGHSSNFPWMEGEYNDVFSLLDKVVYEDEVIAYYDQKKYTYKIRTKEVIRPGDVSVLKRDKGISEITLMTCWPIGTTLNRMILIGELVSVE